MNTHSTTNDYGYFASDLPRNPAQPADRKDGLFLIFTYLSVFLLLDPGIASGFNLGFTLAYAVLFFTATVYLFKKETVRPFPALCGVLSLLLCPIFTVRNDGLGNFVAFLTIALLFSIYIGGCSGTLFQGVGGFRLLYDCLKIQIIYPFAHLGAPFSGLKEARRERDKKGRLIPIILGLLACLPVLLIVIPLLIQSDYAFAGLMEKVLGRIGTTLLYLFLALLLTPFVFALLYALRHRLPARSSTGASVRIIDSAAVCGFLGALSAVYLIYLLSQLAYFFSAFQSILPAEYTAANYARKGFFELCILSLINLFLLFCACTLVKKRSKDSDIGRPVKGFGIFLCLFNLVLVGTAISKMVLYIDRFGLTRLRVLTTVFMILMGVLFLCLAIRLIFRRFPYMAVSLILCTLIGSAMLYADVNTTVANYNVNAYLSGDLKTVDFDTVGNLGPSAAPALARLAREANDASVRQLALLRLDSLRDEISEESDVFSYNYTLSKARELVNAPPKAEG